MIPAALEQAARFAEERGGARALRVRRVQRIRRLTPGARRPVEHGINAIVPVQRKWDCSEGLAKLQVRAGSSPLTRAEAARWEEEGAMSKPTATDKRIPSPPYGKKGET